VQESKRRITQHLAVLKPKFEKKNDVKGLTAKKIYLENKTLLDT